MALLHKRRQRFSRSDPGYRTQPRRDPLPPKTGPATGEGWACPYEPNQTRRARNGHRIEQRRPNRTPATSETWEADPA